MIRIARARAARALSRGRSLAAELARARLADAREIARGLGALAVSAWRVARQHGVALIVLSAAAAFLAGLGSMGSLMAVFVLGMGAAAAGGRTRTEPWPIFQMGTLVALCALPCAGAVLVGARLAESHGHSHYAAGWALFLGVTFFGTLVLLPLLEAAARLAGTDTGLGAAISASLVAMGRRGLVRTLLVALLASAAIAIVPLLDVLGPMRLFVEDERARADEVAMIVGGGTAASVLLVLWLGGTLAREAEGPRVRTRSALSFLALGSALLVTATTLGLTLLPVPLATLREMPRDWTVASWSAPHVAVQPTIDERVDELIVHEGGVVTDRIAVEGLDHVVSVYAVEGGAHAILLEVDDASGGYRVAYVDSAGRLGDEPLDRIRAHASPGAAAALALSGLLILAALWRSRGRMRLFRAMRRGTESILPGRLRAVLDDVEGEAPVQAGLAHLEGWQLESNDASRLVTLPGAIPLLGAGLTESLPSGQPLVLLSPEALPDLGFRAGAAACPQGAALVLPESGRFDALVASWAMAPAGLPLAASALAAVAATVLTLGGESYAREELAWLDDIVSPHEDPVAGPSTPDEIDPVVSPRMEPAGRASSDAVDERARRIAASPYASALVAVSETETTIRDRPDMGLVADALSAPTGPGAPSPWDALSSLLGFREGDVVIAVAGVDVRNPAEAVEVAIANRGSNRFGVRVLRDGVLVDLVFELVPGRPRRF